MWKSVVLILMVARRRGLAYGPNIREWTRFAHGSNCTSTFDGYAHIGTRRTYWHITRAHQNSAGKKTKLLLITFNQNR